MAQTPGPAWIPAPPASVPTTGALAQLPVTEINDPRVLFSGVTYETDGCEAEVQNVDFVDYADCIRTAVKTFDEGLDYVQSFSFSLYRGVTCRPGAIGGGDNSEYEERARRRFTLGESRGVERKLAAAFSAGALGPDGGTAVDAAIDITPSGDALTAKQGVALLFEALGNAQVPIILAPRAVGVLLNEENEVEKSGGILVVGAGFETNGDGTATLYGTGHIHIWHGPLIETLVNDDENNYTIALVERQYTVSVECQTFKVDVRFAPGEVS